MKKESRTKEIPNNAWSEHVGVTSPTGSSSGGVELLYALSLLCLPMFLPQYQALIAERFLCFCFLRNGIYHAIFFPPSTNTLLPSIPLFILFSQDINHSTLALTSCPLPLSIDSPSFTSSKSLFWASTRKRKTVRSSFKHERR